MSLDPLHLEALEAVVLAEVLARPSGMSEYELIRALRRSGPDLVPERVADDHLVLFRTHFLLFHVLYRLRDRWLAERRGALRIHTLSIRLEPYTSGMSGIETADPLRSYYLDLENLDIGREDVEALLEGFWRQAGAGGDRQWALDVLGLEEPVDYPAVRHRYRRLAMRHHPDRGGDTESLQEIHRAMSILARCYGQG